MPNKRGKNRSPFLPDWGKVKFTPSFRIKRELTTFPLSSFRKHFHYEQTQHKEDYQKAIYVLCRLSCLRFSFRVLTLTNNIEIRISKIGKISNKVSKVVCNQNKLLQGIKIIICRSDMAVSTFACRFVSYSLPLYFLFCWQFTVLF